ncbi:dipeptide epimerase [Sphingomonas sp. URHD0057]|uniref:dipeptide epimerase n=1 Tax=Sphingomonas sp. URHD0057 TaxID=1380389 RepID=UPI00048BC36A|nr:dipeptide epimerase [Sphingomonas sp. URHD0057]
MARFSLHYRVETHRLSAPFRISGFTFETSDVVVAELSDGEFTGRGEAAGVYYFGDDSDHIVAEIEAHRHAIEDGPDREDLRRLMPAGGARNAVDCALWDLEAKREGVPAHRLAGIADPKPLITTFTLGADEPEVMAEGARRYADARAIKVKLTGELRLDIARVEAIRAARPDVWLGVDANQGYTRDQLDPLVEALNTHRVSLLEQPLARGREADLEGYRCPIPIAADESALTLDDVAGLVARFDVINIKLDKCGGLTEALLIAREAKSLGLGVMVGNMVGTSLAMAPAFIVGQHCDVVDLDGPTFLIADREPSVEYRDGMIRCPDDVWGSRAALPAAA